MKKAGPASSRPRFFCPLRSSAPTQLTQLVRSPQLVSQSAVSLRSAIGVGPQSSAVSSQSQLRPHPSLLRIQNVSYLVIRSFEMQARFPIGSPGRAPADVGSKGYQLSPQLAPGVLEERRGWSEPGELWHW